MASMLVPCRPCAAASSAAARRSAALVRSRVSARVRRAKVHVHNVSGYTMNVKHTPETDGSPAPHRAGRIRAVALVIGMVAGCLAIWTASPLGWLWVASQVDAGGAPTMQAIAVVVVGVVLTSLAIGKGMTVLHARYRRLRGQGTIIIRLPWGRTQGSERTGHQFELTVLDVILVSSVLIALALYNYWFLFEAGSPLDQRSGRR